MLAAGVMHGESAFAVAAAGGGGRIAERGKEDKDEGQQPAPFAVHLAGTWVLGPPGLREPGRTAAAIAPQGAAVVMQPRV